MSPQWIWIGLAVLGVIVLVVYVGPRLYWAPIHITYMTEGPGGFMRNLMGLGVRWNVLEFVVRGKEHSQRLEYVAVDPVTKERRAYSLLNSETGSINLRPQVCQPHPFIAETFESKRMLVEAKVTFRLSKDNIKYIYEIDNLGQALDMRIQSAFSAEFSKRHDEDVRKYREDIQKAVLESLSKEEADGVAADKPGKALGVDFLDVHFAYEPAFAQGSALLAPTAAAPSAAATSSTLSADGSLQTGPLTAPQSVLSIDPGKLDTLLDTLAKRDPNPTQTVLAMLEMHTRQAVAGMLAAGGNVVVVTPEEIGVASAAALFDARAKAKPRPDGPGATS